MKLFSPLTCVHGLLESISPGHGSNEELESEAQSAGSGAARAAGRVLETPGHLLELVRHLLVGKTRRFLDFTTPTKVEFAYEGRKFQSISVNTREEETKCFAFLSFLWQTKNVRGFTSTIVI